jgi:hypothetical protein
MIRACADVFSYTAEIHNYFTRMQDVRKGMGGPSSGAKSRGLTWDKITNLKFCAGDILNCFEDRPLLSEFCFEVTAADHNSDVEGELNVWLDGLIGIKNIVLNRD